MVGKLTAVLIRKEAEAYRAQGLHEEAFALYNDLLTSSPNIDEALKSDIEYQMDLIAEEMEAFSNHSDEQMLSSKEMMQLKNGWDNGASPADMLISAQGLCQIGAHRDALIEFAKVLKSGIAPDKVAHSAVKSFTGLYDPKKFPNAAEKWLRNIYTEENKVLAVHLLLLRGLSQHNDKAYALQYCRYIRSKSSLPPDLIERLDSAQKKFKLAIKEGKRHHPVPEPDSKERPIEKPITARAPKEQLNTKFRGRDELEFDDSPGSLTIKGPMDTKDNGLKEIFAEDPDDSFDDEIFETEEVYPRRGKGRLHFIKIIGFGWLDRLLKSFLPKKREKAAD